MFTQLLGSPHQFPTFLRQDENHRIFLSIVYIMVSAIVLDQNYIYKVIAGELCSSLML